VDIAVGDLNKSSSVSRQSSSLLINATTGKFSIEKRLGQLGSRILWRKRVCGTCVII